MEECGLCKPHTPFINPSPWTEVTTVKLRYWKCHYLKCLLGLRGAVNMVSVYAFNSSDCFLPQSLTAGPFGFEFEAEWTASSQRFNKPPLSDVTRRTSTVLWFWLHMALSWGVYGTAHRYVGPQGSIKWWLTVFVESSCEGLVLDHEEPVSDVSHGLLLCITVYYCLLLFITSSIFDLFCHMINVLHKCWVWFYMSPFQTLHFVGPSLNSGVELGSSLVVGATLALAQKSVLNETHPLFHPRWLPHPLLPFYLPSRCGCSVLDSGLFSLLFSPSDEQ